MICNTIGLTADSFDSIYTTGGTEVEEVYGAIDYAQPIYAKICEITGTSPLTFTSRVAGTLTDYRIYGETIQDGTPSPDMPVEVVGCGVRTENLYNIFDITDNTYLNQDGSTTTNDYWCVSSYIPVDSGRYTAVGIGAGYAATYCCLYDADKNYIGSVVNSMPVTTINVPANCKYVRLSLRKVHDEYLTAMFVIGETVPSSYIPYGYKLPVTTTNGTDTVTTPIYIGAEPLHRIGEYADYVDYASGKIVRGIKKLVLTGEENFYWYYKSAYMAANSYLKKESLVSYFCSHYNCYKQTGSVITPPDKTCSFLYNYHYLVFSDSRFTLNNTPLQDFKSYLAAQYAAGTPVTVWYVLETPIEEDPPVSFPALPPLSGINTMSVDTTVKPSQIYVKGKIKPDGYGNLTDKNGVYILDKDGVKLTVHGQGTSNA